MTFRPCCLLFWVLWYTRANRISLCFRLKLKQLRGRNKFSTLTSSFEVRNLMDAIVEGGEAVEEEVETIVALENHVKLEMMVTLIAPEVHLVVAEEAHVVHEVPVTRLLQRLTTSMTSRLWSLLSHLILQPFLMAIRRCSSLSVLAVSCITTTMITLLSTDINKLKLPASINQTSKTYEKYT